MIQVKQENIIELVHGYTKDHRFQERCCDFQLSPKPKIYVIDIDIVIDI
jgi:hypothetical protein